MLIQVPEVLSPEEAATWRETLEAADWVDGKVTAGARSGLAKQNQQLSAASALARELGERIVAALQGNAPFLSAALPFRVFPPLFTRCGSSHGFGSHVDNAIRQASGTAQRIRIDLSATLFLSGPEQYEEGELLVEDTCGLHNVKLPAGDMVLYPSSSLHRAQPISRGVRVASFFRIQSMIRDDGHRTLLFDLDNVIQRLNQDLPGHPSAVQLTGVYHNLLRRWAESMKGEHVRSACQRVLAAQ